AGFLTAAPGLFHTRHVGDDEIADVISKAGVSFWPDDGVRAFVSKATDALIADGKRYAPPVPRWRERRRRPHRSRHIHNWTLGHTAPSRPRPLNETSQYRGRPSTPPSPCLCPWRRLRLANHLSAKAACRLGRSETRSPRASQASPGTYFCPARPFGAGVPPCRRSNIRDGGRCSSSRRHPRVDSRHPCREMRHWSARSPVGHTG